MTIREREANCVNPPASARTSSTVVQLFSSKRPGRATSPMTDTLKLRTSDTITDTSGLGMYSASFFARTSRSSSAVSPAACTSFSRGSEILPSGLTGTARLIGSFFQTEICSMSSGPIRYASGAAPLLSDFEASTAAA